MSNAACIGPAGLRAACVPLCICFQNHGGSDPDVHAVACRSWRCALMADDGLLRDMEFRLNVGRPLADGSQLLLSALRAGGAPKAMSKVRWFVMQHTGCTQLSSLPGVSCGAEALFGPLPFAYPHARLQLCCKSWRLHGHMSGYRETPR